MYLRPAHRVLDHDNTELVSDYADHNVTILHPGYADRQNVLFSFMAQDRPEGGIHYGTVITACGIIAGNRWDGYLSITRGLESAITLDLHQILPVGRYYFNLPHHAMSASSSASTLASPSSSIDPPSQSTCPLPYPIIPSFRDWPFPEILPPLWEIYRRQAAVHLIPNKFGTTDQTATVRMRDSSCRLTESQEGNDVAHIVPVAESEWFIWNSMSFMGKSGFHSIDSASNNILLRSDLHKLYDQHRWLITPKERNGEEGKARLTCHLFTNPTRELTRLYHNAEMHEIKGVDVHYLVARFALAIFTMMKHFLVNGLSRQLTVRVRATGNFETKEFQATHLMKLYDMTKSRSRSVSPKKGGANAMEQDEKSADWLSDGTDIEQQSNVSRKRKHSPPTSSEDLRPKRTRITPTTTAGTTPALSPPNLTIPSESRISCTCLSPPLSPASSVQSEHQTFADSAARPCKSPQCRRRVEAVKLQQLREEGLQIERVRSETGHQWRELEMWARDRSGMSAAECRKWYWVMGAEVDLDEEDVDKGSG